MKKVTDLLLNDNKNLLYLGLEPPEKGFFHYPIIKIVPLPWENALARCCEWTDILFTSQTAVTLFFALWPSPEPPQCTFIAIGKKTAQKLREKGVEGVLVAAEEAQEGVVKLLSGICWKGKHLFFPHAAKNRPLIANFLKENQIEFSEAILYETVANDALPSIDLSLFKGLIFTSPSTVEAFIARFGAIPPKMSCYAIGPVTQKCLDKYLAISYDTN